MAGGSAAIAWAIHYLMSSRDGQATQPRSTRDRAAEGNFVSDVGLLERSSGKFEMDWQTCLIRGVGGAVVEASGGCATCFDESFNRGYTIMAWICEAWGAEP